MSTSSGSPEHIAGAIAERLEVADNDNKRMLVAVAGPPATGKSTVAELLCAALDARGNSACLVPMDGFHLDNTVLSVRGLLDRKGAPETFDLDAFSALLKRLPIEAELTIPTFDRDLDRVIPDGRVIGKDQRVCVVEGNYLLLDAPGWRDLQGLWDVSVFLETDLDELEDRLIRRWLDHGLAPDKARQRAQSNDIPNARLVLEHRLASDLTFVTSARLHSAQQ